MPTSETTAETDHPEASPWKSMHWAMFALNFFDVAVKNIIWVAVLIFSQPGWIFFWAGIGFLISVVFPAIKFFSLKYQLIEGHLRIREGVFSKRIRSIPVRRIHNINTSQTILARILNVQRLDIETAGGGQAEASFSALSKAAVQEIQTYVRRERERLEDQTDNPGDSVEASEIIYRVRAMDLILAGATTSKVGAIFVAFGFYQYLDDYLLSFISKLRQVGEGALDFYNHQSDLQLVLTGIIAFILLWLLGSLFSIGAAFIRWHGFTLIRSRSDLNVKCGLLTQHEFAIPRDKIQAMRLHSSLLRRPFGLFEIRIQTAGHSDQEKKGNIESDMLLPITHLSKADFFVRSVFTEARWDNLEWQPVHPYTRTRQFRLMALIYVVGVIGFYTTLDLIAGVQITVAALVLGLPLLWLIAHYTYKQTAYALEGDFAYIRKGFIGLQFWVIPVNRIQNMAVRQNPFQRRFGLGTLVLDIAGGLVGRDPTIQNIPVTRCWKILNQLAQPVAPTKG